jgi:hypothetical protein
MLHASNLQFLSPVPRGSSPALALNHGLERAQAPVPEGSVSIEPGIHRPQGRWIQVVKALPALPLLPHQMSAPQQPQVF